MTIVLYIFLRMAIQFNSDLFLNVLYGISKILIDKYVA